MHLARTVALVAYSSTSDVWVHTGQGYLEVGPGFGCMMFLVLCICWLW